MTPDTQPHCLLVSTLRCQQTDFQARLVIVCLMLPLFVVGVVGNVLSALVFLKLGLRVRINLCLFVLAVVHVTVPATQLLSNGEDLLRDGLHLQAQMFYFVGLNGSVWASQFLSAVIASERCFCVVSPFHAKRLVKTSTMAPIIVVCCVVLVAGMMAVVVLKHRVIATSDPISNVTQYTVYVTEFYVNNKQLIDIVDIFLYGTAMPAVFLIVLFVASVITAVHLHTALARRSSLRMTSAQRWPHMTSQLSRRELVVTRMLLGASVFALLCTMPALIFQVTSFIVRDLSFTGRYYNLNSLMWALISLCRDVNCCANVFIYVIMGTRFRRTLRALACTHCLKVDR